MLLSCVCGKIKLVRDNLQANKNGICNEKFGQFPVEPSAICSGPKPDHEQGTDET